MDVLRKPGTKMATGLFFMLIFSFLVFIDVHICVFLAREVLNLYVV